MTMNEYQTEAMRTASGVTNASNENLILNGAMGLCGESGEIIDLLKKNMFQGHDIDKEHLAKECGDVLWYVAVLAKGLGYELDEIAEMNKAKLRKRYPDGFEVEKSLHRARGGYLGMISLVEQHKAVCEQLNSIYEQKNMAYGNSFSDTFNDLGIISAVTRISDKFNRLKTLAKNKDIPQGDESISDTLLDMANYCIMTYMEINRKK